MLEHECATEHKIPPPPPYSLRHWADGTCRKKRVYIILCVAALLFFSFMWWLHVRSSRTQLVISQVPTQTLQPATSQTPATASTFPPSSLTSQPPTSTTAQPPTSTTAQPPTSTATQPPTSTTAEPPISKTNTQQALPWSFSWTCFKPSLTGTMLSAYCQTRDDIISDSRLDLNCFIANTNGVLRWTDKDGHFMDSSREHQLAISMQDTCGYQIDLLAKCRTPSGSYVDCRINLSDGIENIGGVLTPRSGTGSGCKTLADSSGASDNHGTFMITLVCTLGILVYATYAAHIIYILNPYPCTYNWQTWTGI